MKIEHIRQAKSILRQLADPTCLDWISDGSNAESKVAHGNVLSVERGTQGRRDRARPVLVLVIDQGQGREPRRVTWRVPAPVLEMVLKSANLAILERGERFEFCQAERTDEIGFLPWGSLGRKGQEWKQGTQEDINEYFDSLGLPRLAFQGQGRTQGTFAWT